MAPIANQLQLAFPWVVATQDWHPPNHGSFAVNHPGKNLYDRVDLEGLPQTLWPTHCVQNTPGAELAPALERERIRHVFQKGTETGIDSYSGFSDNSHRRSTGLGEWLRSRGISEVFICGLATDYCVKFTALDSMKLGFITHVIVDACRGVNLRREDEHLALNEMTQAGVRLVRSAELLRNSQGSN